MSLLCSVEDQQFVTCLKGNREIFIPIPEKWGKGGNRTDEQVSSTEERKDRVMESLLLSAAMRVDQTRLESEMNLI